MLLHSEGEKYGGICPSENVHPERVGILEIVEE